MSKIRKVIEEVEQDVERVLLRFKSHVRHDGKDYHAGDTGAVQTDAAAALVKSGAAVAAEPDTPKGDETGNAAAAAPAEPAEASGAAAPASTAAAK